MDALNKIAKKRKATTPTINPEMTKKISSLYKRYSLKSFLRKTSYIYQPVIKHRPPTPLILDSKFSVNDPGFKIAVFLKYFSLDQKKNILAFSLCSACVGSSNHDQSPFLCEYYDTLLCIHVCVYTVCFIVCVDGRSCG